MLYVIFVYSTHSNWLIFFLWEKWNIQKHQFCLHTRILYLIRSYINLFQAIQEYYTLLQGKYTLLSMLKLKWLLCWYIHHNTFFNISDHMMQYVETEFKGSPATENFSCRHTKTSAIVSCIGNFLQEQLIQDMKNWLLSIMVDGSNNTGSEKMLAITENFLC